MQIIERILSKYKGKLDNKKVRDVIKDFNYLMVEDMMSGGEIKLGRLGIFSIKILDGKLKKLPDWKNSVRGPDGKYTEIAYITENKHPIFHWCKYSYNTLFPYKFVPNKGTKGAPGNVVSRMWKKWRAGELIAEIKNYKIVSFQIAAYNDYGDVVEFYNDGAQYIAKYNKTDYMLLLKVLNKYVPYKGLIWKKL